VANTGVQGQSERWVVAHALPRMFSKKKSKEVKKSKKSRRSRDTSHFPAYQARIRSL
jgi:hypothetical protein